MTTGLRPGGLWLRDLDDDDILDVLVLDTAPVALAPLLGPDLSEGPRTDLGSRPGPIALAHLDGDGSLDAVLFHGDRLGLWRGVGDGRFTAAVQLEFSADVIEVVLPDLNADGRADVVAGLFPDAGLAIRLSGP
nr:MULTISPECIES: VCBS repeat-containing protein [unclassified Nannocystis]